MQIEKKYSFLAGGHNKRRDCNVSRSLSLSLSLVVVEKVTDDGSKSKALLRWFIKVQEIVVS